MVYAFLAREVTEEKTGQGVSGFHPATYTAHGILHVILARKFPVKPPVTLMFLLEAPSKEGEEHAVRLRVVDPDGTVVAGLEPFNIQMHSPRAGFPLYASYRSKLNYAFEHEGVYEFEIHVDGHLLGGASLAIVPGVGRLRGREDG